MPATTYARSVNVNVDDAKLLTELAAAAALQPRVVQTLAKDAAGAGDYRVLVTMDDALTGGQEAALTAAVAAHTGKQPPTPRPMLHATGKFAGKQEAITSIDTWQDLGDRIITTPGWFSRGGFMLINAVAQCRAVGAGAQLRLVEDPGHPANGHRKYDGTDERVLVTTPIAIPDTGNDWWDLDGMTNVPLTLTARCEYRLQGRLGVVGNQAVSASVRICDAALLEIAS